ncbi:MAG TPA: hypothetical protein VF006_01235 [Longimicrobium sp.]
MRMVNPVCALLALVAASGALTCADFENGLGSMSVKTPKGKFECINNESTDHLQVLRLAGRVIYEEVRGPDGVMEDSTLRHGIVDRSLGCPWVVAVHRGLVVIGRELQPPRYGVQGYAVIDFNKAEPTLTRLAAGQRPEDENIASARRLEWSEGSLVLRVFGYTPDEECCSLGSPAPRALRVRYTYENGRVEVVR